MKRTNPTNPHIYRIIYNSLFRKVLTRRKVHWSLFSVRLRASYHVYRACYK